MGRTIGRCLGALLAAGVLLLATAGESAAYVGIKGGAFLPNDDEKGLEQFDTGYGGEFFFGGDVGPISLELGVGAYTTKPEGGDDSLDTFYGAGTAKLYLPLGPASLYGGGGLGYYFSQVRDEDPDGDGIGFHAVGGAEFSLGAVSLLGEVRWSVVELEFADGADDTNVGGIMLNVGVIF